MSLTLYFLSQKMAKSTDFPDNTVVQGFNVRLDSIGSSRHMIAVHGRHDDIHVGLVLIFMRLKHFFFFCI